MSFNLISTTTCNRFLTKLTFYFKSHCNMYINILLQITAFNIANYYFDYKESIVLSPRLGLAMSVCTLCTDL